MLNPLIIKKTRNSVRISNEYASTRLEIGLGARNALGAESSSRIVGRQCAPTMPLRTTHNVDCATQLAIMHSFARLLARSPLRQSLTHRTLPHVSSTWTHEGTDYSLISAPFRKGRRATRISIIDFAAHMPSIPLFISAALFRYLITNYRTVL